MADPRFKQSKELAADKRNMRRRGGTLASSMAVRQQRWKATAMRKSAKFFLTTTQLVELYESQAGRCWLSGIVMVYKNMIGVPDESRALITPQNVPEAVSLIRKDPSLPYELGNVVMVTQQVSMAVGLWGIETVVDMATNIVKRQLTNDQIRGLCG